IGTLDRIVSVFPVGSRDEILSQLASNIVAVIYQVLIPQKDQAERILATEIMLGTMAVKNLIRRNDFKEIRGLLDACETEGMHSLEISLARLYKDERITYETAKDSANYQHCQKLKEALNAKSKKLKFVVIDHNKNEIKLIAQALMNLYQGEILFSESAKEGTTLVETEKPDVVIVGTHLKDMDGFDFCRRLKTQGDIDLKVIIISPSFQSSYAAEAASAGADDFVVKTADYRLLTDAIDKVYG
ncbi:MAG: response regulator, partial [Candidatus Omnitrophica bacterium]|nr:response regulator [Candidatus Omnitrophota bacterium]